MASLYELNAEYFLLLERYDSAETDEEREEVLSKLASTEEDMDKKSDSYARLIRIKTSEVKAYREESARLTKLAQYGDNLIERLKNIQLENMKLTDRKEVQTSIGKWRLQNNPWSCEVVDIDRVPMEYHIKQDDKIDKKGLLDRFKATGEVIEGVVFRQDQGIRFR